MFVITGGVLSMMSEEEPNSTQLIGGAVAGGVLGSTLSYFSGASIPEASSLMSAIGGAQHDMKVGLPNF